MAKFGQIYQSTALAGLARAERSKKVTIIVTFLLRQLARTGVYWNIFIYIYINIYSKYTQSLQRVSLNLNIYIYIYIFPKLRHSVPCRAVPCRAVQCHAGLVERPEGATERWALAHRQGRGARGAARPSITRFGEVPGTAKVRARLRLAPLERPGTEKAAPLEGRRRGW